MLKTLSPASAQRLREFFADAGYLDDEFRKRPSLRELPSRHAGNIPYLLDSTRDATALNTLLRLFLFGMSQEASVVSKVVSEEVLAIMVEAGMLRATGTFLAPEVMLSPLDKFLFTADPLPRMESGQSADIVLWPNQTTRILHQAAVRRPSKSTLDLGAGCGVLSVLAAPYSVRVTATDLNPRAAQFTNFNAQLNGIDNIQTYSGDTFEPVNDQKFDLILANPPFFVTPTSSQLYFENSMELDGYCRRVMREAADHLTENGYLQMTCEWVHLSGETWQDRVAEWMEGTGCDAWIIRSYTRDPAAYAFERTKDGYPADPEKATVKFEEWVAYYRDRKVEAICGGMVTARRRSGQNWLRIEDLPLEVSQPLGEAIIELFDNQTILSEHAPDEALLSLKPQVVAAARLEQSMRPADGRWAPESLKLTLHEGLPGSLAVEFTVADFLARCTGLKTLGRLVEELASTVKAGPTDVRQQCCAIVRKLAQRRFIRLNT